MLLSSAKCTNEDNYIFQKFARATLGTNNVDHCARLCHASTVAAAMAAFGDGAMSNSISDIDEAEVMLVIGSNTTECHPIIGRKIKRAIKERGAQLIVADPRSIELTEMAEIHLNHLPGTDVDTNQDAGKAQILAHIGIDDDGTSYVVATDEDNAVAVLSGSGRRFFAGDVPFQGLFVAHEDTGSFVSTLNVHFFDDSSGGLLQTIEYHTSCSQPIELGDIIGNATLVTYVGELGPALVSVALDIKPQSCPNPLNCKSKGILPVAILGTVTFDVTQVDPATVRLAGVAPLRWDYEDVATPYEPLSGRQDCLVDCTTMGPDGYMDATLKFETQEIVAALGETIQDGDCIVAQLTGNLRESAGGTEFIGEDVIRIVCKTR